MIDASILKQFGLNRNDITVYESLLSIGQSKTGPIIRESGIVSSRVYESLNILVKHGLVSYQVKNNIKYYRAEPPEQLIDEADRNISKLKSFTDVIASLPVLSPTRNESNIYEGLHGLKMAYKQHVENMELNETVSIIALIGKEFKHEKNLRAFFSDTVDRIMIEKRAKGNMITNKLVQEIIKRDRPDSSIYTIRHLSTRQAMPYALNISKKQVMMSVWGDVPIVFTINNPVVVKAFQEHFDVMWGKAKNK